MKKYIIYSFISILLLTGCSSENKIDNKNNTTGVVNKNTPGTTTDTSNNNNDNSIVKVKENVIEPLNRSDCLSQLDSLKADLESTRDKRYESSVTLDLIDAANAEYKLWDDMLNEIYSKLQENLSKEKFNLLTEEELEWISIRDKKSEAAASEYEGGTMAPLAKISSLIESTRDRCYELVNDYM